MCMSTALCRICKDLYWLKLLRTTVLACLLMLSLFLESWWFSKHSFLAWLFWWHPLPVLCLAWVCPWMWVVASLVSWFNVSVSRVLLSTRFLHRSWGSVRQSVAFALWSCLIPWAVCHTARCWLCCFQWMSTHLQKEQSWADYHTRLVKVPVNRCHCVQNFFFFFNWPHLCP